MHIGSFQWITIQPTHFNRKLFKSHTDTLIEAHVTLLVWLQRKLNGHVTYLFFN